MDLLLLRLQIVYTAIMSGTMLMYVITIGNYFSYILKHRIPHAFEDYAVFRKNTRAPLKHSIVLLGQVAISIISLMINYDRGGAALLVGVAVPLVMLCFHVFTGFGKVENLINSAQTVDEKMIEKYLFWNIPLHILYFLLYAVSAMLLLNLFA